MSAPERTRTFLLAAGGTAGHVHPALAVAHALAQIDPGARVVCAGTRDGMESWIVPRAGLPLELIDVRPLRGGSRRGFASGILGLPRALLRAMRVLRRVRPDAVLGVGGHVSGAVGACAVALRVPVALLESNVVPGLANRWIAPYCAARWGGWDETATHFRRPTVVTGVPVRDEIARVAPRLRDGSLRLLVLGGSRGSRLVDDLLRAALPALEPLRARVQIAHQAGPAGFDVLRQAYAQHGFDARVAPYFDEIDREYAVADLVVSAAGAVTCAELLAAGRPAALIALPASGHHQRHNASAMEARGAAIVLDAEGANAGTAISALLQDPERREAMSARARAAARPDAARDVARRLLDLATDRA